MSQDRDFVIELDGHPGSYRLHVSSPAGDDSARVGLDPARLGVNLDTLQIRVLASAPTSRSKRLPELERPLREVGQALFEAVFQASAQALFLSSRNEVERAGGRLRIVLRLHPPELAVLPWELMFSDDYGGYLCRRSPMVRYVAAPEPVRPLTVTPPLRVLGMTALPGDLAVLDADNEQRRLQQLLTPLQVHGLISVDWVPGQSWEAAQDALYAGCHVFHFIGHGGFDADRGEGVIAFANERGRRQLVGASALADLLSVADPMPRLVVLNSCQTATGVDTDVFSSTAATLVRTVPAVVAMQFAITDDAAAVFSRAFYQALVHNRGVDEAVRAGRIALTGWNPDTLEWVTPVLYLRSRDSRLFDLTSLGADLDRVDDRQQSGREAVLAAYWAARSTGDWEPVIAQLGALRRQVPTDREVEQAYQDARLAARYTQGRSAEQGQDWAGAVSHYQAVFDVQPDYRDVAAQLDKSIRSRDITVLQERLRTMFAAGNFQAVAGIADRLAELDPAAADPDGLATQARQRLHKRMAHLIPTGSVEATTSTPATSPGQLSRPQSDTGDPQIPRLAYALAGHANSVRVIVFSPDGRLLASGDDRGMVRLWDPATGHRQAELPGAPGAVRSLAFSPDGRLLAGGRAHGTVRLWDPATGHLQAELSGHAGPISDVAFSPRGQLLASGSRDCTVRLWDPATGNQRAELTGHANGVSCVAFSPRGQLLASGSYDHTVRLWDPAAGNQRAELTGHANGVSCVAFSPRGQLLASGSYDHTVRLWDPAAGNQQAELTGHANGVSCVAFSPRGQLLASGSYDHTVRLWDPATGNQQAELTGHADGVSCVAFSPRGQLLASGDDHGMVRLWDPATGHQQAEFVGNAVGVSCVAFSPDGRLVVSGGHDGTVRLWDLTPLDT